MTMPQIVRGFIHAYIYIYTHIHIYIHTHIYIEREREMDMNERHGLVALIAYDLLKIKNRSKMHYKK